MPVCVAHLGLTGTQRLRLIKERSVLDHPIWELLGDTFLQAEGVASCGEARLFPGNSRFMT